MKHALSAVILAAIALVPTAHAANILVNGDFENEPNWGAGVSSDGSYTLFIDNQIPGWTIKSGHGLTVHNTGAYPTINGYSVNMDGEGYNGTNGDFSQEFATISGVAYNFSFDHLGWNHTGLGTHVQIIDTSNGQPLYVTDVGWTPNIVHEAATFTGTGNTLILMVSEFPATGGNDNTMQVDNFSVSAVPEPASLGLLALASVTALRRRRA